jgi:hypothetical protein
MSRNPAEDVLNELLPYFEAIDTQNLAIVQFLKDKRVVSDEQLAPYLERAAKASNVKWLAARLRMGRLFSVPETENEAAAEKPEKGQERTTQRSTEQRTTQADADGDKPSEERGRGETAEKKSEVNTNPSEDETVDSPEASARKTKSSSSEHASPEKDAKSAPERASDKDVA